MREGEGVAAAVLASFGLSSEKIRIEVEKLVPPGPSTVVSGDLPFTPKAKKSTEGDMKACIDAVLKGTGPEKHNMKGMEAKLKADGDPAAVAKLTCEHTKKLQGAAK